MNLEQPCRRCGRIISVHTEKELQTCIERRQRIATFKEHNSVGLLKMVAALAEEEE